MIWLKSHEEHIPVTDATVRNNNLLCLRQKAVGFNEEEI